MIADTVLEAYIDGWRRNDIDAVLATVAPDVVITECYGPVYRGAARVRQWMEAWLAQGTVDAWQVDRSVSCGDLAVAQWRFSCTFRGTRSTFDGATIARVADRRVVELREYETSAPLYDWTGTWRDG